MLEDKIVTAEVIRFDAAENIFELRLNANPSEKFDVVPTQKNFAEVKFVAKNILKCADKFTANCRRLMTRASDCPVNFGGLCPKGLGYAQIPNSMERTTKPMYRAPGATSWQEIFWDEAIERAALKSTTRNVIRYTRRRD